MTKTDTQTFDYEGGDLEAMMLAENYYRWIADIIRPYIGKNIVEVGAGVGSFSKLLLETNPQSLTLVEPSKSMHKLLDENITPPSGTQVIKHNEYLKGAAAKIKSQRPDTFVYINVFEHIEDDKAEIKQIVDLLQPGGHAIVFVPALQALYSNFDKSIGHYRRYSKKQLTELCKDVGLEVETLRYMDMIGVVPWWTSFVLMKRTGLVPTLVSTYDNLCVPVIRLIEDRLKVPFGKNVLLVAKKKS